MLCLSYRDPWGWLVARGIKDVDNRSWSTSFRGRIYIHVSKTFDYDGFNYICTHPELVREMDTRGKNFCIEEWAALAVMHPNAGKIIGEVDITACMRKNTENPRSHYGMGGIFSMGDLKAELQYLKKTTPEYFSPWFSGPFGLVHKNPELYAHPVPCKGTIFPHFFEPGPGVETEIINQNRPDWRKGSVCETCINACPDPNCRPQGAVIDNGKVKSCTSHSLGRKNNPNL